ncbi:hypothetical protein GOP47_0012674 [Adiantum capillus-veneris]|uniref:Uncharacterized protein n=1 Tax=Adiantum capillus-veneris TaxID=13818 RepID=A0A9D4UR52_ADICA|nr:hypothetical protein GOP47_0012674 [Adiantum capillus-veneris]
MGKGNTCFQPALRATLPLAAPSATTKHISPTCRTAMDKLRSSDIVDAVLAPTSVALLLAYHIFLFYKVRTRPMQTRMGINHKARRLWVYDMLIENHKKNVLAVQTLRNSIMESTLMATTAVLLTAGLATYFTFGTSVKQLPGVLSCFMVSFLCHTQSIRFINHVNYMVNIPMDHLITADYVADLMERGTFISDFVDHDLNTSNKALQAQQDMELQQSK